MIHGGSESHDGCYDGYSDFNDTEGKRTVAAGGVIWWAPGAQKFNSRGSGSVGGMNGQHAEWGRSVPGNNKGAWDDD